MKSNKFYKERKPTNDQSKWDHTEFDRIQKEEHSYEKIKHSKHKNNDNYYYRSSQKNDLNTLVSDKYQKVYSEKTAEKQQENDDKWKHDKFNENSKENNNYHKNKGKKPDQAIYQAPKRFSHQKYEEKTRENLNSFKQNVEEKEPMIVNDDKLSNVSTANSDKKNQVHEEEFANTNQNKKIDYEFRLILENEETCLRIDNLNNFDESFETHFEDIGSNDVFKNLLIKIHFLKEIIDENQSNHTLIQQLDEKMNIYLEKFEKIRNEKNDIDENEMMQGDSTLTINKWDDGLQEI